MEFTVSRKDLVRELNLAKGIVENRTTIPILSNVLISTGDGCINLTATDLELGIRCSCPAVVIEAGTSAIPARRLLDYVRLLPDADVQIKVKTTDNHWATLTCERSKARIAGMLGESFPELPSTPEAIAELPGALLADSIGKTVIAVSQEASRFTLNGAQMALDVLGLTMVATDGHRLAFYHVNCEHEARTKALVSLKSMCQLLNLTKDEPEAKVAFSEDDNHLFFQIGKRTLMARKMTGSFPDYERVMPKDLPAVALVGCEQLKGCLERVAQFADERSKRVLVSVSAGEVKATSSVSETGDSEESVAAESEYDGAPIEIGFNASYLLDFLRVVGAGQVTLHIKDASTAGEMRIAGKDHYRYVVMPMRA